MKVYTLRNKGVALVLVLLLWYILSKIYSPIVIPTIPMVFKKVFVILTSKVLILQILITLKRLFIGFFGGVILSVIASLLITRSKAIEDIFYPIIKVLQVIPPISFLILAILWFGLNGKPSEFIVFIAVFSVMTISLVNGIKNIDKKLLEISSVFHLSKAKKIRYIVLPAILESFDNSFIVSLSLAIKITVMGEVLTTNNGIGGKIFDARLNIETETVIAWTVIIIILYYILEGGYSWLKKRKLLRNFWYQKLAQKNSAK